MAFATPEPAGIFLVAKVFLVSGLFNQAFWMARFWPSTIGLETETLTLRWPVIGKKMFFAVEAFALALLSLHRFPNQRNRSEEKSEAEGKKIHREEKSEQRRRKKKFQ
jgi:hypothetical protein